MCREGIDHIMPQMRYTVLQRNNWTGSSHSIDEIGLPSMIHNLWGDAWLRAKRRCCSGPEFRVPGPL